MLKPELQDLDTFVTGMKTIIAAQKEAALNYFADGSVAVACPPLKALLHIILDSGVRSNELEFSTSVSGTYGMLRASQLGEPL